MNIRRMRDARSRGVVASAPRGVPSPPRHPTLVLSTRRVDSPPRRPPPAILDARVVPLTYSPILLGFRSVVPIRAPRDAERPARGDDPRDERGGHHEGERARQECERRRTASRAHSPTERPRSPSESPRRRVRPRSRPRRRRTHVSPERESSRAPTPTARAPPLDSPPSPEQSPPRLRPEARTPPGSLVPLRLWSTSRPCAVATSARRRGVARHLPSRG